MNQQEHHEMVLETTHSSGAEEWYCPTCGRRFLLQWPPTYKKTVLDPGDEFAAHSGSKSGTLRVGAVDIGPAVDAAGDELLTVARDRPAESANEQPPAVRRVDEELGDVPITDELQPWLRWLATLDAEDAADEPDLTT